MAKNLIIVESPSKCKTIEKYLGKENFRVVASVGHVREIPTDKNAISLENFETKYVISDNKKDVVNDLKKAVKDSELVYYASDYDREGESISWHLQEILQLPKNKYKRITFTEITKKALEDALKNPRDIDMDLVDAQRTRQILDRISGFGMSGLLNYKVQKGTSAGRVQSIGLLLICNNWKVYQDFYKKNALSEYRIIGIFEVKDVKNKIHQLKATLNKKFKDKETAYKFLEQCKNKEFYINSIEKSESRKKAPAPFTTSSMQIDAIRKLGMTAERVSAAAQGVYMAGLTSYIRTDSVTMSEDALNAAETQIKTEFGDKFSQKKQHQTKSKNSQESHECIRPSYFDKHEIEGTSDEQRLYELIWKRAVASQMSDCILDKTVISIGYKGLKEEFICRGETIKFEGFMKVYTESTDEKEKGEEEDDASGILPEVKQNQKIEYVEINGNEIFQKPKALFNEATLIKELENIGVGRPSTIGGINKTLTTRLYVEKKNLPAKKRNICNIKLKKNNIEEEIREESFGKETGKLIPTDLGITVCNFLIASFPDMMNPNFTAQLETSLDLIAEGKKEYKSILKDFNNNFQKTLKTAKSSERPGGRELGIDPVSGKPVSARLGRFGPMIMLGEAVKQEKGKEKEKSDVKFAKLPEDKSIDTITLEEALDLLKWPKNLGEYKKEPVECNTGKFGPYVKHSGKYYSINIEPEKIKLEEAIEIIEAKLAGGGGGSNTINTFGEIKVLNGKFGPYINFKKKNFKIPATYTAENLTEAECKEIVGEAKSAPKKKAWGKKKK